MFRHEWKHTVGVLVSGVALIVVGWWLAHPGRALSQPAKEKAKANEDPFGYSAHFERELKQIGKISPQEFARRYPGQAKYIDKLTWDPTTAKFWDDFNRDPKELPQTKHFKFDFRFNEAELAGFKKNGFVVSERLEAGSFAEMYYRIYSRDLPVFISTDSLLHAWHRSYDGMLEELEETYLATSLDEILSAMAKGIPAADKEYGNGVLRDSLADADYFLAMARSLLAGKQAPTALQQEDRVALTLLAVERKQLHKFNLFGRQREMDFSQFEVRGHYENSDRLKKYFKAMMWCGRIDLRIAGGKDYWGVLSSPRELGSAVILNDLLLRAKQFERWQQFDRLIQTYVGRTDSATFAHLGALLTKAGIKSPADLKTIEQLEALQTEILAGKVGLQDIRGDVYTSPFGGKVELPRSFTVLGQKFVVDSWVTAKVVFDDVPVEFEDGPAGKILRVRRVPSCLDVAFAALGNDQVVPLLVDRITAGTHRFRDKVNYQNNLAATRNVIDAQQPSEWDVNLYMGWLATLRELSKPTTDAKYPEVLRTKAWAMKSLNTQLASWTHLRHDTILYAKQSYTSDADCFYPAGFVEPVPHVWSRMEKMLQRAAELMEKTPFPNGTTVKKTTHGDIQIDFKDLQKQQAAFLRNFAQQVGTLKTIATKQLEQKELTAAETKMLKDIVQKDSSSGHTEYNGWYTKLFWKSTTDSGQPDPLVADVHTDVPAPIHGDPGCVLHQGVGNVDLLLIAIDNGKDRMVYAGPVLSHYEFEMPGIARKPDSEWRKDLDAGRLPPRPEWTRGYLVPRKSVR
ncbi:MAG: DUF3160 domain-containing protein [Planctomycetes bacterium]|nr:DUF3160 domain-containing protein [Planctomycetota bacterium]